jgi:hypothetical protein
LNQTRDSVDVAARVAMTLEEFAGASESSIDVRDNARHPKTSDQ